MSTLDTVLLALGRGDRRTAWRMAATALLMRQGQRCWCWRSCWRWGRADERALRRRDDRAHPDGRGRAPRLRVDAYMRAGIPLPGRASGWAADRGHGDHLQRLGGRADRRDPIGADGPRALRRHVGGSRAYGFSTPVIGRALGNRDHSTVLSGIKRAEELREDDPTSARSRTACSPSSPPKRARGG
jgi:hypothetical protein